MSLSVRATAARDQGAVGGDDGAHALSDGIGGQFRQVLAHQRLASGKEHHRNAEGGQVVDQGLALRGGQFVRAGFVPGMGVAVHAAQVAAAGDVPDHHRFLVGENCSRWDGSWDEWRP